MAGKPAIEVIDAWQLWRVCGGVDKQTQAAQTAIDQATNAVESLAKQLEPKHPEMGMLLQMMGDRRGRGPGSAPALPPPPPLAGKPRAPDPSGPRPRPPRTSAPTA